VAKTSDLMQTYALMDGTTRTVIAEFQKDLHKNRFFNNKEFLVLSSDLVAFDKKAWHLRPEFFSYDYYGSPELFRVVLLVNDISTRFNFRAEKLPQGIYAPTVEAIEIVLSQDIQ